MTADLSTQKPNYKHSDTIDLKKITIADDVSIKHPITLKDIIRSK